MVLVAGTITLVKSPVNLQRGIETGYDHRHSTMEVERYSRGRINSTHRQKPIRNGIVNVIQLDATDGVGEVRSGLEVIQIDHNDANWQLTHGKNEPIREAFTGKSAGALTPYPRTARAPAGYRSFVTDESVKTTGCKRYIGGW